MTVYVVREKARSYGHIIGVLTLDEAAPFIPGSVGNASTYGFPVLFRAVAGLKFVDVFNGAAGCEPLLIEAARDLEAQGVKGIAGSCGFMAWYQEAVADAVSVPVFLSSLIQLPLISASLGRGRGIGIIAADEHGITGDLLASLGMDDRTPIRVRGMKNKPAFRHFLVDMGGSIDVDRVQAEVVEVASDLAATCKLGAILLECSELPPYAAAIQEATGLPTYDFITLIDYFYKGVTRQPYRGAY
jgi:hypothetical protein